MLVLCVDVGVDDGDPVEEALRLVLRHVDGGEHVVVDVLHRALLGLHPQHRQPAQLLAQLLVCGTKQPVSNRLAKRRH